MSFFAGVFGAPNAPAVDVRNNAVQAALGLKTGSRLWQSGEHGLLAHAQSVVTPEDRMECLPALFDGGRQVIVFDGRIDNREELIESLRLSRELPDSQIVSAAIERWGEDACCHLLGDFAFASWDMARRRLLLACDHVAGRVIFYHVRPGRIMFATTMNAIWSMPGVSAALDLHCVARLLLDTALEHGRTPYREIHQLPAACRLTWSPESGVTLSRYWAPDFTTAIRYRRDDDYVDHARELLDTAVRCRMRAIGPLACQLSGGFDSSGVTATAARLASESIATVTAVPGTPVKSSSARTFVDEWEFASAVARMYPNIEAYAVPAAPPEFEDPRHLFQARGMPVRNFTNVSWFEASNQKVRDLGSRVLLAGTSGNMTLSWGGNHRIADLVSAGRLWALQREVFGLSREGIQSPWTTARREILPRMLPVRLRGLRKRMRCNSIPAWQVNSPISKELTLAVDLQVVSEENHNVLGLTHDSSLRLRYLDGQWRRAGNALLRQYLGFERRDPLGDIRLLEFCIAIPSEQYMLDGITRRLARRTLADRVPQQLLRENRKGRQSPEWFYRLNCERERLVGVVERLKRSPLASYALDVDRMNSLLHDWPTDAAAAESKYFPLIRVLARGANVGEYLEWVEAGFPAPESRPTSCQVLAAVGR